MVPNKLEDLIIYNQNNQNCENNNMDNSDSFSENNNPPNFSINYLNSSFSSHNDFLNNNNYASHLFENINTNHNTNVELNNNNELFIPNGILFNNISKLNNNELFMPIEIMFDNVSGLSEKDIFKPMFNDINELNKNELFKPYKIMSNNINELNNSIEIEINIKENNKQNKFRVLKMGRPKKNQENNEQRTHNKNSFDNARQKIYNSCKLSIYNFIHKFIPSNLRIKLHIPTIKKQKGYSHQNNINFFKKTIYDIFCDSTPKRVKNEIKDKRNEYNFNQVKIDMLLKQEENNPKIKEKKLKTLFNLTFKDFLMVYLNDKDKLKSGDLTIDLKGFKTFGQCFNENKNKYTEEQKRDFKSDIFDIIENRKKNRSPRAKIHNNQ